MDLAEYYYSIVPVHPSLHSLSTKYMYRLEQIQSYTLQCGGGGGQIILEINAQKLYVLNSDREPTLWRRKRVGNYENQCLDSLCSRLRKETYMDAGMCNLGKRIGTYLGRKVGSFRHAHNRRRFLEQVNFKCRNCSFVSCELYLFCSRVTITSESTLVPPCIRCSENIQYVMYSFS